MSYWAVAQTQSRREQFARDQLARSGFEAYAPMIRLAPGRTATLFPNYLFVRVVDCWYPILWTMGIARVLMSGDGPARLPDQVMASIREREGRDGFIRLPPKHPRPGQRMRIVRGMFEGHLAMYAGMAARDRQRVLIEFVGRQVTVELPLPDAIAI